MEFSERLKIMRTEAGLTQEQLAEKLYVSRQAVSNWEQGRGYPSIDMLVQIAKLFNVSLDGLLSTGTRSKEAKLAVILVAEIIAAVFVVAVVLYYRLLWFGSAGYEVLSTVIIYVAPLLFAFIGLVIQIAPPHKVNHFYGYRTIRSMKNQTSWAYAHVCFARVDCIVSIILIALTLIFSTATVGVRDTTYIRAALIILQSLSLIGIIIYVEHKLKKFFG